MNRIRELRELRGLTIEELAELVGTSHQQISKLELNKRRLTVDWMQRLAKALNCSPAALIATATLASDQADIEPHDLETPGLAAALASKNLKTYKVVGSSVAAAGLVPGKIITVDESQAAIDAAPSGSIVVVEIPALGILVLRQLLLPGMLVTNQTGANLAVRLDDATIQPQIRGVVIPAA